MKLKKWAIITGLCLATLAPPSWAGRKEAPIQTFPIIMVRKRYVTNCSWSSEQVRMGGAEVSTYLVGHGGEHDATVRYTLDGDFANKYEMFEATVGYKDNTVEGRAATFEIWVNGQKVTSKGPLVSGDKPEKIRANIKGAKEILLRIVPEHYNDTLNALWGDPMLCSKYYEDDSVTSISINGENHNFQTTPNTFKGEEEFSLPLPLYSGTHEFVVHYEYDTKRQRVDYKIEHTNAHPQVGATFTKAQPKGQTP